MDTGSVSELIIAVADEIILPRFRSLQPGDIQEKGPGDLVTVADRLAELALTDALLVDDPGALVVGEEATHHDATGLGQLRDAPHAWVVDPVDGTRNFARGRPGFAVMMAEVVAGVTQRAWIWQPVHQRMYVGVLGEGVTCNGAPIERSSHDGLIGAVHPSRVRPGDVTLVGTAGSCGIDYPLLVEGERDFLVYSSLHPWDHLPGALMVNELGGRVATIEGREYRAGVAGRRLVAARDDATWRLAVEQVNRRTRR